MFFKKLYYSFAAFMISLAAAPLAFCQDKAQAPDVHKMFSGNIDTARKLLDMIAEFCVKYSFQALGGVIILIAGWLVSRFAVRVAKDFLLKHKLDVTVVKFMTQLLQIAILAMAVLIALGSFGITIAPFIAGLSVAGFGLSFAIQGPLSNYAAGATLVFTKPFKVGDIIEVTGVMGEVVDMTLARTEVKTVDGTQIVIPNKQIIGEIIHNYSDHKKVDVKVGVSYDSDMDKVLAIVRDVIKADPRVSNVPEAKVGISDFGDSNINVYARIWCRQSDYWDVLFSVNKKIDEAFRKNNIVISFQQVEVRMLQK